MTNAQMHPFEKAGLGKAPFYYAGYEVKVGPIKLADGMTQIGSPGQPMGSCDFCGQGIAICVSVKSSDGQRFVVGQDCAEKIYRQYGTEERDPFIRKMKEAKRKHNREVRHKREAEKIAAGKEWAEANREKLEVTSNPQREGESLWDKYEWFMKCAGNAGKIRVMKELKKTLEG